jgi:hypothetical protein
MFNAPEELLERLAAPEPDIDAVLDYLVLEADDAGVNEVAVEAFFRGEEDLAQFRLAIAWWPQLEELPPTMAPPSLYQLLWNFSDAAQGATFMDRLTTRANVVTTWLLENGFNPANPAESAEERKRRLNSEAQRRFRLRAHNGPASDHAAAVAALYREYMDICAQRKIVLDAWAEKVQAARDAWMELKKNPPGGAG